MVTTNERPEGEQSVHAGSSADAPRERGSPRRIALFVLGAVCLLALAAGVITLWRTYRPYRGC